MGNRIIGFLLLVTMACKSQIGKESNLYQESHRPQFHFSPPQMWMNDPNGMVFYDGEYHLFYQNNPDSTVWGPMHWGHAVSKDLVHWENLPIALYPDSLGFIFSGSAVVDWKNTTGLGETSQPPLVAIFTYHNPVQGKSDGVSFQSQAIAYSTDKGRSWQKYSGNPVLPNPGERDFRDPKVFWYETTSQWKMVLAVKDRIFIYSSPDLKVWHKESEFGDQSGAHEGVWECPDLFPLSINSKEKWVMLVSLNRGGPNGGSATQYFIDRGQSGKIDFTKEFVRQISAPRIKKSGTINFDAYIDVASLELFIDDGTVVLTSVFFPRQDLNTILIETAEELVIKNVKLSKLESIWNNVNKPKN